MKIYQLVGFIINTEQTENNASANFDFIRDMAMKSGYKAEAVKMDKDHDYTKLLMIELTSEPQPEAPKVPEKTSVQQIKEVQSKIK